MFAFSPHCIAPNLLHQNKMGKCSSSQSGTFQSSFQPSSQWFSVSCPCVVCLLFSIQFVQNCVLNERVSIGSISAQSIWNEKPHVLAWQPTKHFCLCSSLFHCLSVLGSLKKARKSGKTIRIFERDPSPNTRFSRQPTKKKTKSYISIITLQKCVDYDDCRD